MNKIAMIAAAGKGSRMLSLTENNPKAMLPFNSKPIIGHHLDYLIEEGFTDVVIVVGYQKEKLINYVNEFYKDKIKVRFAEQKELNGLAGAIHNGIEILTEYEIKNASLLILLGDIVLEEKLYNYHYDYVGYDIAEDWSRWCLIETNEADDVIRFIDKPDEKPNTRRVLMGVYNITDIEMFEDSLNHIISSGKRIRNEFQLSQVLEQYMKFGGTIHARPISRYHDLGELHTLNKTRKNITRHFNSITSTDDNTIIKSSSNIEKIQKEIDWFVHLDMVLSLYVPHMVSFDYAKGIYELEFIHSNPLQELYLFNLPETHEWINIFKTIKKYIDKSKKVPIKCDLNQDNYLIMFKKTIERVELLKEYEFAKKDFITINNITYKNPIRHLDTILELVKKKFCHNSEKYFSNIHGDLFFGNMLYDISTNSLKIVDPRGEYGRWCNQGDIRYDIAKLNHSINGYYDFIINGLYFLEEKNDEFFYHFYESKQNEAKEIFKCLILKDYDEQEINLLTGLLFLTMIPLHSENPKNQKMQFIRAVEILNNFI